MIINHKILLSLSVGCFLASTTAVMANHARCQDVHAAAFLDEPKELAGLLGHGVDLDCLDNIRQTPLITATEGASLDVVRLLLKQGVNVNARDEMGQTALTRAQQKVAFFDMEGGLGYRQLYKQMIDLLERAGATQ